MNAVALTDRGRVRSSNQDTVFAENHAVGRISISWQTGWGGTAPEITVRRL